MFLVSIITSALSSNLFAPSNPSSKWYQQLNWLTNFCLTTNELHTQPKLHPSLIKILETCDIPTPNIIHSKPLLIPIAQWLPADWLVTIPFEGVTDTDYIKSIMQIWEQFQNPSLRIFLPKTLTLEKWETLWSEFKLSTDITLVLEN
jgi:hypothetical protein